MAWTTVGNLRGPKGEDGPKGDSGTAATVSVGTVATGAPGSAASVVNGGTSSSAVLNFTIPRGDKGDKGDTGDTGAHVTATDVLPDGNLELTLSNGQTLTAGYVVGPRGEDGTSVNIQGSVATASALPTNLTAGDAGTGYITSDTGHLDVWSGSDWTDVGNIKGPKGDKGNTGDTGQRGSRWFFGVGTPTEATVAGAIVGDAYMDTVTGDVYRLA